MKFLFLKDCIIAKPSHYLIRDETLYIMFLKKILIHFNMDFDKTEKAFSLIAIDSHCASSSNLFHGQIAQIYIDQLRDPENKKCSP
jgi:hypothetical protein